MSSSKRLSEKSPGSVRRVFSAAGASPILADAAGIDCVRLLPDGEKSLAGPQPGTRQTASKSAARMLKPVALTLGAFALLATSACTVKPLYGRTGAFVGGEPAPELADLRGRIDVAPSSDRTTQIVRNGLLFGFNGGEKPVAPFYKITLFVTGSESVVQIQQGSGVPAASLFRMNVTYTVQRTTDGRTIARGTRFANAPFDRSRQLFAASRAFRDAQERSGQEVAEQVRLAALAAIRKDLPNLLASVPPGKS